MAKRSLFAILILTCTLNAAQPQTFEVTGTVEDVTEPVHVRIYGVDTPFTAAATSSSSGAFKFRKVLPGTYTLGAFVRGHRDNRRTVVVSASLADAKGVIRVRLPLGPTSSSTSRVARRATVSVAQLSIPDTARKKFEEANKALSRHDAEQAKRCLLEAVAIAPKFGEAWNSLGVMAYQAKQYPDAEHNFRNALDVNPGGYMSSLNLGGVLLNLNRAKEALPYNKYVVEARPTDPLANAQTGMNYFQLGDLGKAEHYLKETLRLDPAHFSQPQLLLARIYGMRGDKEHTKEQIADFLTRYPDSQLAVQLRKAFPDVDRMTSAELAASSGAR